MRSQTRRIRAAAAAVLAAATAGAGADRDARRAHGAHEHGLGTLGVVIEGDVLAIELAVPAVHAVGFEHAPQTERDRAAVDEAVARFRDAVRLFELPAAARCEIASAEATIAGIGHGGEHDGHAAAHAHDESGREEAGHGGSEHRHGASHEPDAAHGHDDREPEATHDGHAELEARYRFRCAEPGALDRIGVRVFEHLDGAETIEAAIVTESTQSAVVLRPGAAVIDLAR